MKRFVVALSLVVTSAGVVCALDDRQQSNHHQSTLPSNGNSRGGTVLPGIDLLSVTDHFHAVARPSQLADLPPLTMGVISQIHVSEGEYVQKGDPLVTLDDRVPRARLKAATVEANLTGGLKRAQVQLRMAESRLKRIREAVTSGAGADFELMEAEADRDQALAVVQQQQDILKAAAADRELAQAQLEQYTIRAPFDGMVVEIHVKNGAVDPSQKVVTIANLDELEVEMHVPARLWGQIRTGDILPLRAGIPVAGTVNAKVASVSPVINSASNTFRCLLKVKNGPHQMPAGFSVALQGNASAPSSRISLRPPQ